VYVDGLVGIVVDYHNLVYPSKPQEDVPHVEICVIKRQRDNTSEVIKHTNEAGNVSMKI
jgi:hypothetical protein